MVLCEKKKKLNRERRTFCYMSFCQAKDSDVGMQCHYLIVPKSDRHPKVSTAGHNPGTIRQTCLERLGGSVEFDS